MINEYRSQGFKKYFSNTIWLISEKFLRITVGLFVGIWVIRYLGPSQFGLLAYVQSLAAIFTVITTLGLDRILVREMVLNPDKSAEYIGTAFIIKFTGSIFLMIILLGVINSISSNTYNNMLIFIVASSTIFQSFNVIDMYFQSKVLSKFVIYVNIFSLLFSSAAKVILIMINSPLEYFAWAVLFDNFILALGFIYILWKRADFPIPNLLFKKTTAVFLLKNSWPLALNGLFITIYMKIDLVMIREILNTESVGQYAAATKISEIFLIIPMMVVTSLFPAVINAKKTSQPFYYKRLQSLFDLMVWIAVFIAFFFTFLSDTLVTSLYGEDYKFASNVLKIHIWSAVFVSLGMARSNWILAENLQMYSLIFVSLGAVSNISLNYFLIPVMGINGAAIATLITSSLVLFSAVAFSKTRKVFFMNVSSLLLFPSLNRLKKYH